MNKKFSITMLLMYVDKYHTFILDNGDTCTIDTDLSLCVPAYHIACKSASSQYIKHEDTIVTLVFETFEEMMNSLGDVLYTYHNSY